MHWETENFMTWFVALFTLLWYLEPDLQYLRDVPVFSSEFKIFKVKEE